MRAERKVLIALIFFSLFIINGLLVLFSSKIEATSIIIQTLPNGIVYRYRDEVWGAGPVEIEFGHEQHTFSTNLIYLGDVPEYGSPAGYLLVDATKNYFPSSLYIYFDDQDEWMNGGQVIEILMMLF